MDTPLTNRAVTRVRTDQTDLNGAMYHGAYFDIFEGARVDVFRDLGYTYARTRAEGFLPVVRKVQCEYLQPAFMDDELQVMVTVTRMTAATMSLRYDLFRGETVLAHGEALFAFLDVQGRPIRIPTSLRECVENNFPLLSPR